MVSLGPPDRDGEGPAHGDDCSCGLCGLLDLLGRKWTPLLLGRLQEVERIRFNELKRSLDGVSPRTLSDRLTELEEAGLVERIDHGTIPPKVEYELSEKGEDLHRALGPLVEWAREWEGGGSREPVRGPAEDG